MHRELPPEDRLVPLDEAAQRLGRSYRTVARWIWQGLLHPYKRPRDRHTYVDLAELPEALREAGRPGPKPKREPPERGTMPS